MHFVLGLSFPQYISDSFADCGVEERRVTDDNTYLGQAGTEARSAELEERYYCEVNVFWMQKVLYRESIPAVVK